MRWSGSRLPSIRGGAVTTDADDFALTLEQAAVLFAGYVLAITRMEQADLDGKAGRAAIPRDVLCVADALMLIPAGLVLTAKLYRHSGSTCRSC